MVFNSLHFVAFFAVVYALYRVLPHRAQNLMLLAASYYFYAAWDWRFLGLLIAQTVLDFTVARLIHATTDRARKRWWLLLSLAFNLGMLGFFKYFNFFAENLHTLAAGVGLQVDTVTLRIVLPVGISFYTFMTISYVVDVYRGIWTPSSNFVDFALYVAYFPHLVAGPILRAKKLIPQLEAERTITWAQCREGLWLIAWGMFQKVLVADNLARVANEAFAPGATPHAGEILLGVYAFAFQIFGDFAGYSNMARGISKLMGIELSLNFLTPYFVTSPSQFWRHWHISLSEWLRDYLYIPLGGNRHGTWKTYRNLMITMGLGGLWHGAAWTFVIWGLYQGIVLVAGQLIESAVARTRTRLAGARDGASAAMEQGLTTGRVLLGLLMFHVTCYGWLIFRARSGHQIADMTRVLATDWTWGPSAQAYAWSLVAYALPLMVIHAIEARRGDVLFPLRIPTPVRYALYAGIFYATLLFGDFGGSEFIYFQF